MQIKRLVYFFACLLSAAVARGDNQLTTLALSAGQKDVLALRSDGTVWAWGTNQVGETGLGTNKLTLSPSRITSLTNIISIAAGPLHSLAVQSNGVVWAWGTNNDGRLGNGTFTTSSNPVPVTRITNAVMVAAGGNHSLAALADGRVMAWGANFGGQLGTGNTVSTNQPVTAGSFTNVIAVAAGTNFSLALTLNGDVWSWGTNNYGQLGLGNTNTQLAPVKITTLSNIVQIAAGDGHALARSSNGWVFAWGRNSQGQLGDGTTTNSSVPKLMPDFGTTNTFGAAQWIEANFNSSAAISAAGQICYWGYFNNGWTNGPGMRAAALGAGIDEVFSTVTYGDGFLLASESNGAVWSWGNNSYGQWGNGRVNDGWGGQSYEATNPKYSFSSRPHPRTTTVERGDDGNLTYSSFVLPIDLQGGVELGNTGNELYNYSADSTPWFLKIAKVQGSHILKLITGTTNVTRFPVDNPIATYGSAAGGSPLYVGQPETFGAYAGAFDEKTGQTSMIRISVYSRAAFTAGATNVAPTNVFYVTMPRRYIAAENNNWANFINNGYRVVVQTNGLRTVVEFADRQGGYEDWGMSWLWSPTSGYMIPDRVVLCGYRITHTADSTATNFYYKVDVLGVMQVASNTMTYASITNGNGTYLPLYAMDFETLPAWRSSFIDAPHFDGLPLPPTYAGKSKKELNGLMAVITNSIWLTNNPAYTNLDNSPELRQHPILDQFVTDMGRDPLALASYVINEIALTDPIALTDASRKVNESIEPGGVARSALSTFLEGQGSPSEQCALLVYLLRRAGYSAAYVFPTNNNMRLLDTRVSDLWQMQVKGIVWQGGMPVVTDSLLQVDYPWVVVNIGTNSVQIFPWLKDNEIVEGQNIYDYMPANYPTAYSWIKDFIYANPALTGLAPANSSPVVYWQTYLQNLISTNTQTANLSLDDFGMRGFNRRHSFPTWDSLPVPNYLTNQSQVAVVATLSDSTNTFPFLASMFDRIRYQVYKTDTTAGNLLFDTGEWRVCDLQARKLLLFTNNVNQVTLYLEAYRAGLTNLGNFGNFETGTNSLNPQRWQTNVADAVTELPVQVTYKRRSAYYANPAYSFTLPMQEAPTIYVLVPCRKNEMTALVFDMGKMSPAMMNLQADNYWSLETQRAFNPSFAPANTDDPGTAAALIGLGYLKKVGEDNELNGRLHKIRGLSSLTIGRAGIAPLGNGRMQIGMNMAWNLSQLVGNVSLHEESSGDTSYYNFYNYMDMMQLINSGAEGGIINTMFGDNAPISAARVLQIASENARAAGWAFPLEVNVKNYTTLGGFVYPGYGTTTLAFQDWNTWLNDIPKAFTTGNDTNFLRVLTVPGLVSVASAGFQGSAQLYFDRFGDNKSVLSTYTYGPLNGGLSSVDLFAIYPPASASYELSHSLDYTPSQGYSFNFNGFDNLNTPGFKVSFSFSDQALMTAPSGAGASIARKPLAFTPQQATQGTIVASAFNLSGSATANYKYGKDVGFMGQRGAQQKQKGSLIADPVQVVSGDFYSDTVDLSLAGPMPLQFRRSYMSRNVADNQMGYGWRLGFTPWLVLSTSATGDQLIDAAEMDGSVVAYCYQSNNLWTVGAKYNPTLANFTASCIGATANLFNNRIVQNATNSQVYTLLASDGSQRTYQVMTNFGIVIGTNHLDRVRPYLTRWQDHAGNFYTFTYGTNSAADDYGQLTRIESSSGPFLALKYDYFGHLIEVFTDDDRRVQYEYDDFNDLISVTLPDNSGWKYGYQHYTFTTNSFSYADSYHLLTTETKPNGRQLVNTYDTLRRVTMQQATVGINRELITNAWFYYTNDCTALTNDNITGFTRVEDVFHNPYFYYYTNNFIARIEEPLGRTNIQNWFTSSETNKPGYYPNSLEFTVDARGLTSAFLYDSSGNLTNQVVTGDLTGNGIGGDSATNLYTFTTNNCPATALDASGNQSIFLYEDASDNFRLTSVQLSNGGVGIATNRWNYTNVSTVVNMGGWFKTNSAFGLRLREIKADAATNEWAYNGRGFPSQITRYAATADVPGNSDPAVVTYLTFTPRGDLFTATDASGRQARMNYDAAGRMLWRDVLDEFSNIVSHETYYYNRNGDLEWLDGPRSNPDDLRWFSYDGAGRKVQDIQWRSRAKADGTGIEAETGDNLYATTFYSYDYFGNLKTLTDPRGALTTNAWDALGRLSQRKSFDTDGATLLATENFGYEVGGLVHYYTNALGGVTETRYTSTGQPRFRQNADTSTNGWTYWLDGRIRREIQGNGAYWETTYNDAAQTVTRIFYSAASSPLATNVTVFDRRGNPVQLTDAAGSTFTNSFDGLGRLKSAVGPATVTITENCQTPGCGVYVTNVFQQTTTYLYDASGKTLTVTNALGEKTVTTFDALGRTLSTQTYASGSGTPLRVATIAYSADNNSFTATSGSGANAISTTTYTDTEGRSLLSVAYPAANANNLISRKYDLAGNLLSEAQASIINSSLTTWQTTAYSYDGLNRVKTLTERDNAVTQFGYDSAGDLLQRAMPGNLTWSATYNNAGQILTEQDSNGASTTRNSTYTYYPAGNAFAGLLNTFTDGNGVTRTGSYDDWLRVTNVTTTGSLPEQQMSMTWQYEPRGFVTDITQSFASTNTGPATEVQRSYDSYGQLGGETILLGGAGLSGASQGWDTAGRRTTLSAGNWSGGFAYQADGLMTAAGGGTFGYANNGLLTGRTNSFRSYTVNQRDGVGHPLLATTRVLFGTALTESWSWLGDGSPSAYVAQRSDFTDTRNYSYGSLNRRLTQESFNVGSGQFVTNAYTFDNGAGGGLGMLTKAVENSSTANSWSGGQDAFSRIVNGTNSVAHRPAYGNVNGRATLSALLDGRPVAVTVVGTNGGQWRATLDLTPGTHQLTATAVHPSGLFVTNATATFTNNAADYAKDAYDGNGQITNRVWLNAAGQTNRTQSLTWDAFNRLVKVSERDSQNSGYNWQADFDPLGRRIRTTTINVTNGVVINYQPTTIVSYYDPQVEFLEIGVAVNGGLPTWKNYGPDVDGVYGSQQGLGGLESLTTGFTVTGLIQDSFGNVLGAVTNGIVGWNAARVDSYGPVAGYPALSFESGPLTAEHLAWRGKWRDVTSLYYWGARPYDSERRAFMSSDPFGHAADASLYSAFNGSPSAYWDPDGRFGKQAFQNANFNPYARELNFAAGALDYYSATTDSSMGGGTAEFFSHFAHMAVNNGSPSIALNQGIIDYQAGGVLNVANRYNPIRSPFQAVSGVNLMQGDGFGEHLSTLDRSVDWLNTVGLAAGTGAGLMRPIAMSAPITTAPPLLTAPRLLSGEGTVGTYDALIRTGSRGDNLTPHHMPSAAYMEPQGISRGRGIAMNMEQPSPGIGGRHRMTRSYGASPDFSETPRQALARDIMDARRIYMQQGLYTSDIRQSLQQVIDMNVANNPSLFMRNTPVIYISGTP